MRTQHRSTLFIVSSLAALALAGPARAADSGTQAPAPAATAPGLVTPTRTTPVSASQTGATPVTALLTDTSAPGFTGWTKPSWLSDLSFGVKESYDDNILRVSGNGLATQSSWVNVASFKIGFDLSSFLAADPGTIQTFSIV